MSWLVDLQTFYEEEIFDAYILWPLHKKNQNWIVARSTAHDFTAYTIQSFPKIKGNNPRLTPFSGVENRMAVLIFFVLSRNLKQKQFFNSCEGFFRKSPFCTFFCINPGFGGPWNMLWKCFLIAIFITLQKNAFGQNNF